MKTLFCAVLICMSFSMAKGQCLEDNDFRTVSSCDGSSRSGSNVFVDMNKIGRRCTCTVHSLFVGELLVTSYKVTTQLCNTRVIVNNTVSFYCNQTISATFKVGVNDKLFVRAEDTAENNKDSLKRCVGFNENGGRGGTLSVTCGTLPSWTTTPTFYTTTTSSTLRQCPFDVVNRSLLSSCEGIMKHGPTVFVDFYKISRPCTCTVTPSFDGSLLVVSREAIEYACNTEVAVQNTLIIGCPTNDMSFLLLNVKINQTVDVRARYVSPSTSGTFQHCMGFQQNVGLRGNLSVVCGSNHSAETTSVETSTTTASSTTRLISTTFEVSSVELITTSAINENRSDATRSTAATLSEENESESLLSLQISLALFVMISTVSTILNIYFCRYIKTRKKSRNGKSNSKGIKDHRSGTATNAETYTELGNTVSGESENQYDSISRQENYINTNVF